MKNTDLQDFVDYVKGTSKPHNKAVAKKIKHGGILKVLAVSSVD